MSASLTDILTALKNGVTAINNLAVVLGSATQDPLLIYGFDSITSAPTTVVTASTGDSWPTEIAFHNPSSLDILVYPSVDANGVSLGVVSSSPGGSYRVYGNGGTIVIEGGSTSGWLAISTGTGALTVSRNA